MFNEGERIWRYVFGSPHVFTETCDKGLNLGDVCRLVVEKVGGVRQMTEDVGTQCVLELRYEARVSELANYLISDSSDLTCLKVYRTASKVSVMAALIKEGEPMWKPRMVMPSTISDPEVKMSTHMRILR